MHTQSESTVSTSSALTTVILGVMAQNLERFSLQEFCHLDIQLLESIAHHASALAQDARMAEQLQTAMVQEFENQERYGFDAHAACGH